jgi:hypothetical protein
MNGLGQDFDDFMVEQGLYDEAKELAAKKLIVLELKQEMETQKFSKTKLAEKMHDNILDPDYNTSIGTLERFASVLGKRPLISIQ